MQQTGTDTINNLKEWLGQLFEKEDWPKVMLLGEYIETLDPEDPVYYSIRGFAALELRNFDESERLLQLSMERGGGCPSLYLQMARIHYFRNDLNNEVFWLKKVVEEDPDHFLGLYQLSRAHLALGETERAEELLKDLIRKNPEFVKGREVLADLHFLQGRFNDSEEALRAALEIDDKNGELHRKLSNLLEDRGMLKEALSESFKGLDSDPNNAGQYYNTGAIFLKMGDNDSALSYLTTGRNLDPWNRDIQLALGQVCLNTGRYSACEAACRAVLIDDPEMKKERSNPGLHATMNRGIAYMRQGDLRRAEECFKKNLRLAASAYYHLGTVLLWQKKYEKSLKQSLRAIELDPRNAEYWDRAGNAWLGLGSLDEAEKAFEKAVEITPYYAPAHYDLGAVCSRIKGREDEAMTNFHYATALDENYPLPYYAIACLYALEGKKDEALHYLEKSVDLGYKNRRHFENDHDLDSLRDDPVFKRIMKKMDPVRPGQGPFRAGSVIGTNTTTTDEPPRVRKARRKK
jgi:tetratricopeptide (TPR) repeat protein